MQINKTNNFINFSGKINIKSDKSKMQMFSVALDIIYSFNKLKLSITEIANNKDLLNAVEAGINITKLSPKGFSVLLKNKELSFELKDRDSLILKKENLYTGEVENYVSLQNGRIVKEQNKDDKFTKDTLDLFDFYILKLRKTLLERKKRHSLNGYTPYGIAISKNNKNDYSIEDLKNTISEIRNLYITIYDNLSKIKNPATRSNIKNSFYSIKQAKRGDKSLSFINQDGNNKEFAINILKKHNMEYVVLNLDDVDLIISEKGEFYKSKNIKWRYDSGKKSVPYEENELLSEDIINKVSDLKKILLKYNEHILNRINLKDKSEKLNSTSEIGQISERTEKEIELLRNDFKECRMLLSKNHYKEYREKLCQFYNMELRGNSPAIIFKFITPQKEDLQLSFPKILEKDSIKILLLDGKNIIKKSFLSFENKLVKFEAKNLSKSKRCDNNFNFYSQTEIDNSGFEKYVEILCSGIKRINDSIKAKEYKK